MAEGDIDVSQFRARLRVLLRKSDLETVTAKALRLQIQEENEVDLSAPDVRKRFDSLVLDVLNDLNAREEIGTPVKKEPVVMEEKKSKIPKKEVAKESTPKLSL